MLRLLARKNNQIRPGFSLEGWKKSLPQARAMASNLVAMVTMASSLVAMASTLIAMASTLIAGVKKDVFYQKD